jgi:myo-inositol 2-dehydrogenase/D-chiro-inositol 1-dehydrogenase
VVGSRGTLLLEEPTPVVLRRDRLAGRRLPANWIPRFAGAYRSELQDWVDAVAAGRPPLGATARDGYVAALVCEAAIGALETGCPQPVRMPEESAVRR